jgi:hypothetical protein
VRGPGGSAIPVTLYALALIAVLVLGTSFVTRRLSANARLAERSATLAPVAEELVVNAVAGWDSVARDAQPVGRSEAVGGTAGEVSGQVWVTRLSPSLYWVAASAASNPRPGLRRRFGLLLTTDAGHPALVRERAWGELP